MSDPTPEERASRFLASEDMDERLPERFADMQERLTQVVREAESAARAKAFEEAVEVCDQSSKVSREFCNTRDHDDHQGRMASVRAHTAFMLAEKIRARAKEAPRG